MNKHTHRGHCQVCLRIQAIDMGTGLVAKHGYNVNEGYFKGTCPGSGKASLHTERVHTDEMIVAYFERARDETTKVAELAAGTRTLSEAWNGEYFKATVKRGNRTYTTNEQKLVPFAECDKEHQERAVRLAIFKAESNARHALIHKQQMQVWAAKIYDKGVPAYRIEDLEAREAKTYWEPLRNIKRTPVWSSLTKPPTYRKALLLCRV